MDNKIAEQALRSTVIEILIATRGESEGHTADAILSALSAPRVLDPVEGDQLPPIGSKVLIHLGREDEWVEHTVVGYYAWPDLKGNPNLHRVFVRVRSDSGSLNVRMLKDVLHIDDTTSPEPVAPDQQLIADLRAEVEALRKDAERLDWLDKNVTRVSDSERYLSRSVYWGGGTNKDVREAIDAARLRDGGSNA